jgi:diguanylate cyclase (GGDEF)-like protein/PAS domain S-box-containing protein
MARMLGCDSLDGRGVFDFVFGEERAQLRERLRHRLSHGGDSDRSRREHRWRRADGGEVHTLVASSVMRNAGGASEGLMAVVTDISDRVATSAALKRLNLELGRRVTERTCALEESNRELAREIVVREYVQAELAASNERLNHYVHELQRHTEDISRLNRLADALYGSDSHAELLDALGRYCNEALGCDGGVLYQWRAERLDVVEGPWGELEGLGPVFLAGALAALEQGQPVPPAPVGHCLELAAADPHARTTLCLPLRLREQHAGALVLTRTGPFWSGDATSDRRREQLLRALAEHVAQALGNLGLVERLREQSFNDALTGLYNRRYFHEQISRELALWQRSREPFALLMLDIDHFKSFNDRHGHHIGDQVLVMVAEQLRRHTRRSDSACRLGGEEFVVLMPGAGASLALARAETIRGAVKALRFDGMAVGESISVSLGVAVYPDHGAADGEALLRAADEALYKSKRLGRDRTSLAAATDTAS